MKYTVAVAVAGTLVLSACDARPTEPDAPPEITPSLAVIGNTREPVEATASSDCGEDVQMTGTFQRLVAVTTDAAGGLHIKGRISYTGLKGTGIETGRQYVGSQGDEFEFNGGADSRAVTERIRGVLVGLGDAPNLVLTSLFHVTINTDGTRTSSIDTFEIDCH